VLAESAVVGGAQVAAALALLGERFADIDHDGPSAYAAFLDDGTDVDARVALQREAVAVVRGFLNGFQG
jgi:hypothetical protein